jgi:restriction endonuclease S subunit
LNQRILDQLSIVIPPPTTQNKIVSILGTYDRLLENNRRRIELLEESQAELAERTVGRSSRLPTLEPALIRASADPGGPCGGRL